MKMGQLQNTQSFETSIESENVYYSLFILVMCIPSLRISDPRDFVRHISGKMTFDERY